MSHLILTHPSDPNFSGALHRSSATGLHLNLGPVAALLLMIGLIGVMGLISLTHLNSMSTKGYTYSKLEDDYQELTSDSELNDMMVLQARSMQVISQTPQVARMVMPENVYYLETTTGFAQLP